MSIRDLFTRSPKGSEVSSQAAPSTDQDVGIEISGTMPDLGNPELNQLAQTLLAMSAKFISQQAEANAKIRQDMANAYSEASSAGAASSGGDVYLPRRGAESPLKVGFRLPDSPAEPGAMYLFKQSTEDSPVQDCLYLCAAEGWSAGYGYNWVRAKLEWDWTETT